MRQISVVHAEECRDFACRLAAALAADGHSVWRSGDGTLSVTRPYADAVVVLWSKDVGPAVVEAARRALARRILIPVAVGDIEPPTSFKHLWPIDLSGWEGDRDDPRWQFVRDEIRLAILRNDGAPRAPAARARRRTGFRLPALPIRLIVAGAAGSAVLASAAILLAPAAPAGDAAGGETVVIRLDQRLEAGPREIRDAPGAAFAGDADAGGVPETVDVAASEIPSADGERLPSPAIDRQAENLAMKAEEATNEKTLAPVAPEPVAEATAAPMTATAEDKAPEASAEEPAPETPPGKPIAAPPLPPRGDDTFAGVVFRDCLACPDMAEIPASDLGDGLVPVALSFSSFALSRREVTFAEWDACVDDGGCHYRPADAGWGRGSRPVINVSYADIQSYLGWLSAKSGRQYRVPTDAEWTFAARAGAQGPYSFVGEPGPLTANFDGGPGVARTMTAPTASFAASAYGLYDMHGNVWEWVADCAPGGAAAAPAADCAARVVKGGAWNAPAETLAAESRAARAPTSRDSSIGFRVARDIP